MHKFTIQYFKIAFKRAKMYKKAYFLLNLPIEVKPSLAPLVSFCNLVPVNCLNVDRMERQPLLALANTKLLNIIDIDMPANNGTSLE